MSLSMFSLSKFSSVSKSSFSKSTLFSSLSKTLSKTFSSSSSSLSLFFSTLSGLLFAAASTTSDPRVDPPTTALPAPPPFSSRSTPWMIGRTVAEDSPAAPLMAILHKFAQIYFKTNIKFTLSYLSFRLARFALVSFFLSLQEIFVLPFPPLVSSHSVYFGQWSQVAF